MVEIPEGVLRYNTDNFRGGFRNQPISSESAFPQYPHFSKWGFEGSCRGCGSGVHAEDAEVAQRTQNTSISAISAVPQYPQVLKCNLDFTCLRFSMQFQ